ncbi:MULTISPECIES: DEAD/DEAH box helicase [unclassified Crossiella]|uniref:DEAD/DEAH box helicase n=1 Tax=unclassified Crossiella TaxID=2620835 RepID=UPI001FFEE3A4|nr:MULTISPECIES: DEAD/DEAH box helicase [unclassified Crossiella]MCK2252506.1 DEAD/DEAH box helicase [Crossiella sp. S99.1]
MPTTHVPLQATFIPAEGALAWWGPPDPAAALLAAGLPVGRSAQCRLARPVDGRLTVSPTPVQLVDLDVALPALLGAKARLSPSARAWQRAAKDLGDTELPLPPAAHAVPNAEGTAISSAAALLRQFRQAARTRGELRAAAVRAELRPYQVAGVAWLRSVPGGGILADEMGLGKTLQAISLLATRPGPHLVVCPTSLVGNWRRELARFAPDLPVRPYHGPQRTLGDLVTGPVVVTSYGALRADVEQLAGIGWDTVIFDEAQQVKNPDALASKAAARLTADLRIALTGTPVENRLDELWSILNLTRPGLLGTRGRFRQRFTVPIQQRRSAAAADRLQTLIGPHMLRRTKSEVATDLPPKLYATVACTLTAEQIRLYRDALDRAFSDGLGSGIERRGRILALLTALKQICNHPAQLLGQDGPLPGRSGKFDRATEMLAEIVEDQDRALVFTQYRAMGELLSHHLTETLGGPRIPFLHGGLSADKRDRLVHAFQNEDNAPPILLLSLRAAGFGLNLTRAGHVLHYDRWWNPAVEEQATDRAHRIGQHRVLTVHTLVTGGTVEEHIARMHDRKRALADVVSGDTETALANLPDDDLHAVLALNLEGTGP